MLWGEGNRHWEGIKWMQSLNMEEPLLEIIGRIKVTIASFGAGCQLKTGTIQLTMASRSAGMLLLLLIDIMTALLSDENSNPNFHCNLFTMRTWTSC